MTIETISTESHLVRHDPTGPLTPSVNLALFDWVAGMEAAMKAADYLVDTPAVPDSFWPMPPDKKLWEIPGKNPKLRLPGETEESFQARRLVAVQTAGSVARYGLQIGIPPEVALQGIFVIGGRYSMYAEQMVALVKDRGHGHRVVERTATRCVVEVERRGEGNWQQFEFTIEQAIAAGYVKGKGPNAGKNDYGKDKTGGNDKYNTDPAGMLYARASSIACKTVFPDVLRGMVTREELQDERSQDDDRGPTVTTVSVQDIKTRAAIQTHSTGAQPVAPVTVTPQARDERQEPPADDAPPHLEDPASETGELITLTQRKILGGWLRKLDLGEPSDLPVALTVISHFVGRPVAAPADLLQSEVWPLLEKLKALAAKDELDWRDTITAIVNGQATAAEQIASTEGGDRG